MSARPDPPDTIALLNQHLPHSPETAWFCDVGIPPKKLRKAVRAYGGNVAPDEVLALGDGTVFGSAREGVLITSTMLISGTTDGKFAVPLESITEAKSLGGWPEYSVEVICRDGNTHRISTTCFEKQQDRLIAFLNAQHQPAAALEEDEVSPQAAEPTTAAPEEAAVSVKMAPFRGETSIRSVNAGLRLIGICPQEGLDDADRLFATALEQDAETPLLKGYCRYVGFNQREVDGVFLLTNRRLLLFSMESGVKIVFVELTKRLLGAVPFPFFDSITGFFLFSLPRAAWVAVRGGRERMIGRALDSGNEGLMSLNPPLRCVQATPLDGLAQTVHQVSIGTGVWTGFLSREFGISFAPVELSGVFRLPKDLILPEYETLEPVERLCFSIRDALAAQGLSYRVDHDRQQLTLFRMTQEQRAAA